MKRRSLPARLLLSSLVVALLFGSLELACRLFVPPPPAGWHASSRLLIQNWGLGGLAEILVPHARRFWTLAADLRGAHVSGHLFDYALDFRVDTNSDGLRGPERRRSGGKTILALGDSCTFGLGVEDDESYPVVLQALFDAEHPGKVEVINGGVPGYTAFQGRLALEEWAPRFEPDAVTVCFGFNDADSWAGRSDFEHAEDLRLQQLDARMEISRFYLTLKRLLRSSDDEAAASAAPPPRPAAPRARLTGDEFRDQLNQIGDFCAERGIPVLFMLWPYEGQVRMRTQKLIKHQGVIAKLYKDRGDPMLNVLGLFLIHHDEGPLFVDHVHAGVSGNRLVAEALYPALRPLVLP
jgi:lysophospholipase L1-like esterase